MSEKHFRYDAGQLKKATITPQGYLKADAFATRSGVFLYRKPDGSIQREFRPPEEVFHPDSMQSLAEIAVTNDHPQAPLDVANTKMLAVGFTGTEVARLENKLKCSVTVYDKQAIDDVMAGKQELSGGYVCDIEETPGIHEGLPYDVIQRSIRYNHLAIVRQGRAGPEVRLKLDSKDAVMVEDSEGTEKKDFTSENSSATLETEIPQKNQKGVKIMPKITIDGVEYDLPEGVAAFIGKQNQKIDSTEKEHENLKGKCDALQAIVDKKDKPDPEDEDEDEDEGEEDAEDPKGGKKKDKNKDKKMDRSDAIAYGREFVEVESYAKKVLGSSFKSDGMDLIDMKKAVVVKKFSQQKIDGKSDEYVSAMFDTLKENARNDRAEQLRDGLGDIRNDAGLNSDQIRNDYMEKQQERWKSPIKQGRKA